MTLTRSEVHLRQRCVGVLVPQVDEVEDQLSSSGLGLQESGAS